KVEDKKREDNLERADSFEPLESEPEFESETEEEEYILSKAPKRKPAKVLVSESEMDEVPKPLPLRRSKTQLLSETDESDIPPTPKPKPPRKPRSRPVYEPPS